jgi:DNA-binding transcriptional LysR family regulator
VAKNPLTRAEDARRHRLLDLDDDLPLFRLFRRARPPREEWSFEHVQYLSLIGALRVRALEGCGVTVLPLFHVREDIARGRLQVLMPGAKPGTNLLQAVWRKGQPYEHEISALARELGRRMRG